MTTNQNSNRNSIAKITSGILALILAACSLSPAENTVTTETQPSLVPNTPTYTATASQTPTVESTATIEPSPTLVPTKSPEQVLVEFKESEEYKKGLEDYLNAMGLEAEAVTIQLVQKEINGQQIDFLEVEPNQDKLTPLQQKYIDVYKISPIAGLGENGEWSIYSAYPRNLADLNNLILEVPVVSSDKNVENIANQIFMSGELDSSVVFKNFSSADWKKLIANWDSIQAQLTSHKLPNDYKYDWSHADRVVNLAKSKNMSLRAQHLLWGGDVPDSIYNSGFKPDEIEKVAEFIVKARVVKYLNDINQWDIADEWAATVTYPHDKWPFWLDNLGFPEAISKVSDWVIEVDPNIEQVIIEDAMLYLPTNRSNWSSNFWTLLNYVKKNNLPVKRVGIENNFSVFNPPPLLKQQKELQRIFDLGFQSTSETTVVTGNDAGIWVYDRIQTPDDILLSQAQIYGDNLLVYLLVDSDQYGLGGISNATEWYTRAGIPNANSMILDKNLQPTPAFYRILQILYNNLP
jgi:GH35 family endo-1,4-beta-xylanase